MSPSVRKVEIVFVKNSGIVVAVAMKVVAATSYNKKLFKFIITITLMSGTFHSVLMTHRRYVEHFTDSLDRWKKIFIANECNHDEAINGDRYVNEEATAKSLFAWKKIVKFL